MSVGMEATGAYNMGGSRFVKLFSRYTTKYILKIERRLERLCCMEQNVRPIKIRHVQQLSAVEMRIL